MVRQRRPNCFEVFVYDPATKAKRYVGRYSTHDEAAAVEEAAKAGLPIPKQDPLAAYRARRAGPVIYFVAAPDLGLVKVGYTANLAERFSDLATASPVELRIMHVEENGSLGRESELHRLFKVHRVRGEWFRIAGVVAEFLDGVLQDPRLQVFEGGASRSQSDPEIRVDLQEPA